jgi:hypothetical protein
MFFSNLIGEYWKNMWSNPQVTGLVSLCSNWQHCILDYTTPQTIAGIQFVLWFQQVWLNVSFICLKMHRKILSGISARLLEESILYEKQ